MPPKRYLEMPNFWAKSFTGMCVLEGNVTTGLHDAEMMVGK